MQSHLLLEESNVLKEVKLHVRQFVFNPLVQVKHVGWQEEHSSVEVAVSKYLVIQEQNLVVEL